MNIRCAMDLKVAKKGRKKPNLYIKEFRAKFQKNLTNSLLSLNVVSTIRVKTWIFKIQNTEFLAF